MNYANCTKESVQQLSDLINIRSTMQNGWGANVFKNIQVLNLSYSGLSDADLWPLCNSMYYQEIKVKFLNLGHNHIKYVGGVLDAVGSYTRSGDGAKQIHNVESLILCNNLLDDSCAQNISSHIQAGYLKGTKAIDASGNNFTQTGWESFAAAVKSVQAKTIVIKVATADTLQGMKEFLNKWYNHYTETHQMVATPEFKAELLGENTSACEKTKNNVLKAAYTGAAITSLSTGNDILILLAGAEAGAGALVSMDTWDCSEECMGKVRDWVNNVE